MSQGNSNEEILEKAWVAYVEKIKAAYKEIETFKVSLERDPLANLAAVQEIIKHIQGYRSRASSICSEAERNLNIFSRHARWTRESYKEAVSRESKKHMKDDYFSKLRGLEEKETHIREFVRDAYDNCVKWEERVKSLETFQKIIAGVKTDLDKDSMAVQAQIQVAREQRSKGGYSDTPQNPGDHMGTFVPGEDSSEAIRRAQVSAVAMEKDGAIEL